MSKSRIGYCCISLGEHESEFKTVTLTRARALGKEAEEKLFKIWKHNLKEYVAILRYNLLNKIELYRISSDLFPLADHDEFSHLWEKFQDNEANFVEAKHVTHVILNSGYRLCAHPGQFVSIGSPSEKVRNNSIKNLELHARIFDLLGLERSWFSPLNIHLSNGKDNIKNLEYFENSLSKVSSSVRSRLIFETEDKAFWTWQNISKYFGDFPVTLDFHHRRINNLGESEEEAFFACKATWGDHRPIMHISEGKTKPLDRSHHDWVKTLPDCVLEDGGVDLEIEAKKKDLAVFKLRKKYKNEII